MNILVIGNGFDLAHDLPTKYMDFILFSRVIKTLPKNKYEENDYQSKVEKWNDKLPDGSVPSYLLKESLKNYLLKKNVYCIEGRSAEISEFYDLIIDNIWFRYFNKINLNDGKGWIDFESEISAVIQSLDYYLKKIEILEINSQVKLDEVDNYKIKRASQIIKLIDTSFSIKTLTKDKFNQYVNIRLRDELDDLVRCMEIYFSCCVEKMKIESKIKSIEDLHDINKVISFNYTHTYEQNYWGNILVIHRGREVEYEYIHGEAIANRNNHKNNMVLGIDEYLQGDLKDIETEFVSFKKYFQRVFKDTQCQHTKWICDIRKHSNGDSENNIYIVGHSLDATDKDILEELITIDNVHTTIYYHDNEARRMLMENLVRIIGADKFKEKAYGKEKVIEFKPLVK